MILAELQTHTHNVGTSGLGDGVWVSYSSWLRRRRESDEGQGEKRWSICCWQRKRFKKIKIYKNKNKKRAGTTAARHAPSQATTFWVSVGPVWAEGSHPEAFTLYLLHFTAKKLSSNPTYGRADKLPWHSHTRCPFYLFLFIFWNKKKKKRNSTKPWKALFFIAQNSFKSNALWFQHEQKLIVTSWTRPLRKTLPEIMAVTNNL
jgi:hypothetical protein